MKRLLFFLFGIIISITIVSIDAQAKDESNANGEAVVVGELDRQWLKLLHFETDSWGIFESQIDSINFFLSPEGKKDPLSEFRASYKALLLERDETLEEDRVQCRFPARYFYFKKKFPNEKWPELRCPRFEKFFTALRGQSVSLIFSSYYLNNPASAFGHTFLRINKFPDQKGQRYELLDYGVNYAAVMDTDNALVYAIKGLFGGFRGTFTSVPYYYKVREYNDSESRDLWEYELSLSPVEVDLLIAHMWELGPATIDYWYLTENCSYHMLSVLEAAKPDLHLLDRLKKYVVPSDTVQLIWQTPHLVKNISFRPSVRTQFFYRANKLSANEQTLVRNLVNRERDPEALRQMRELDQLSQAEVLDAALDYVDYKYFNLIQKKSGVEDTQSLKLAADNQFFSLKQDLLTQRSRIDVVSPPLEIRPSRIEEPHVGHGSRRAGLGYLHSSNDQQKLLFDYKYSHHDLLDAVQGYPEYALMTFWDLRFSFEETSHRIDLDRWTLFEVVSLNPLNLFSSSPSWRIKVGIEKLKWPDCNECRFLQFSGGPGFSLNWQHSPKFTAYFGYKLWTGHIQEAGAPRWSLAGGPETILRFRQSENQIALFEAWRWNNNYLETKWGWQNRLAYQWEFSEGPESQWALRVQVQDYGFEKAGEASLFYFH